MRSTGNLWVSHRPQASLFALARPGAGDGSRIVGLIGGSQLPGETQPKFTSLYSLLGRF